MPRFLGRGTTNHEKGSVDADFYFRTNNMVTGISEGKTAQVGSCLSRVSLDGVVLQQTGCIPAAGQGLG